MTVTVLLIIAVLAYMVYLVVKRAESNTTISSPNTTGTSYQRAEEQVKLNLDFPKSITNEPHIIFLDLESTGMAANGCDITESKWWPRIVSIAWMVTDVSGNWIHEGYEIIKQSDLIPIDSVRVHGITDEKAATQGVDIKDVLQRILDHSKGVKVFVAHNIDFDLPILQSEFYRNGFEKIPFKRVRKRCTMKKGTQYCQIEKPYGRGYKWPKLSELVSSCLYQGRDIKIGSLHNADTDMRLTAKCFWVLKSQGYIDL